MLDENSQSLYTTAKSCQYRHMISRREILLTTEQVARYLRVDKFTIYRLVAQKKIPAFRVGNQLRFKRSMIDGWLMRSLNVARKRFY